jgi:hypothetical protein
MKRSEEMTVPIVKVVLAGETRGYHFLVGVNRCRPTSDESEGVPPTVPLLCTKITYRCDAYFVGSEAKRNFAVH